MREYRGERVESAARSRQHAARFWRFVMALNIQMRRVSLGINTAGLRQMTQPDAPPCMKDCLKGVDFGDVARGGGWEKVINMTFTQETGGCTTAITWTQ